MLHYFDVKKIDNIRSSKQEILDQFASEFVDEDLDFNVGYHKGTTRIWIRTESGLTELLYIIQSKSPTLWYDQQKRKKISKLPALGVRTPTMINRIKQLRKSKRQLMKIRRAE